MKNRGFSRQRFPSRTLCLFLAIGFASHAPAQEPVKTPPAVPTQHSDPVIPSKKAKSDPAAKPAQKPQTNSLKAVATVKDNIAVEAGLLTSDSAKQLFGGWVADHFAVVQVTIGNQSRDQQFVLQDIFFDYSNWALSGLYSNAGFDGKSRNGLQDYQKGTNPGQISSIGALEVHDAFKEAAVFSRRNTVVNGLVLVATAAGGFAFLGPTGFSQASGAFSSEVIPGLQKFWPDRSIDQQSNILKYGYQDKLVIAKENPGKTYAFFPIRRFLTSGLADLYKTEPALFINPAELYFDPVLSNVTKGSCQHLKSAECKAVSNLKDTLARLLNVGEKEGQISTEDVLPDLESPCFYGKYDKTIDPPGETDCSLDRKDTGDKAKLKQIQTLKSTLASASLNSVRIVVSGIMTVDVETIPATITNVTFDKQSEGASFWKDTNHKQTGVIEGKYLSNGTPVISAIELPAGTAVKTGAKAKGKTPAIDGTANTSDADAGKSSDASAAEGKSANSKSAASLVDQYFVTPITVEEGSTDSELHFSVQFKQPIPNGTRLSFQVVKTSSKSANSDDGGANAKETTTSMTYPYPVSYTPTEPAITKVTFADEKPEDWAKSGAELSGTLTGTNLSDGTPSVTEIKVSGDPSATVETFVARGDISPVTSGSSDTQLNFTMKPAKPIPPGSVLTFTVTTTDKDGSSETSNEETYTTPAKPAPKPEAKGGKATPKKPVKAAPPAK